MGDKSVLYIGSVDANPENFDKHRAAQALLEERAGSLLGIYSTDEQVAGIREAGHKARRGEVEELDLAASFDVVVAADNIEHLANCGRFLHSMERHLAPDGVFLVSTPNPTSLVRILELLARRRTKANVEHTGWYTGQVLDQLARRFGLFVETEVFIDEMHKYHQTGPGSRRTGTVNKLAKRLLVGLNRVACTVFPQLSETFGFVLRKCPVARGT